MLLFTIIWITIGIIAFIIGYNSITKNYYETYDMKKYSNIKRYNYSITLLLNYAMLLIFGGLFSLLFFIMMGYTTFYYEKKE